MLGQYNPILGVILGQYNSIFGIILGHYYPILGVKLGFIKPKIGFGITFPVWEIPTEITNITQKFTIFNPGWELKKVSCDPDLSRFLSRLETHEIRTFQGFRKKKCKPYKTPTVLRVISLCK